MQNHQLWRDKFGAYFHFDNIDSTQQFLLNQPINQNSFCRANTQTAGKGQRGREWSSPRGNLYFTFSWRFQTDLTGLAQLTALTIVEALQLSELQLKWPNDIYLNDKKLAGILIDNLKGKAIVGIGFNLIDSELFSGIHSIKNYTLDEILNLIMPALIIAYENWELKPYLPLNHQWNKYDKFYNRKMLLDDGNKYLLKGIDHKGRLIGILNGEIKFLQNIRICIY